MGWVFREMLSNDRDWLAQLKLGRYFIDMFSPLCVKAASDYSVDVQKNVVYLLSRTEYE